MSREEKNKEVERVKDLRRRLRENKNYLGFDVNNLEDLHSKNSAWREIDSFHRDIKSIMIRICKTCKEGNLRKERRITDGTYECSRCKRDIMIPKRYSEGNNMYPMP